MALSGVRVVDFSHLMPGPWCTQVLGDLGAEVIKIEPPGGGDPSRFNPPSYREGTVYFHSVNRNKRSFAADLGNPDDRAVVDALLGEADVVVETFRPGVARRLGLDYAALAARNPSVVYCSINGYGAEGPLAATPGHDAAIQSLAGLLHLDDGGIAPMPRIQTGDWAGAAYAAVGVLAALLRRKTTGRGVHLEVPMYDALMNWSSIVLSSALARLAGHAGEPRLQAFGANPRYTIYPTRDGKAVTVCLLEARAWRRFCEHVGRVDLAYEEGPADRHTVHEGRTEQFRRAIAEFCLAHDRDEIARMMDANGIAIVPVLAPHEAVVSSIAQARGIVAYHTHPVEGRIPYFVDPLARAGLADPLRRPAPRPGQDNDEIRQRRGFPPRPGGAT